MRPGEFIHYYANLLTLFRKTRSLAEVDDMARAAVSLRERGIDEFNHRLAFARGFFEASGGEQRLAAHLAGWDIGRIQRLREQHGGLLLAIFHYGEHRHVLSDLCCMGIPFVAPIAKHSYFDAATLFSSGPQECGAAPLLLEVESPSVGRHLLTALKRGRIGAIYVDGNMGPDGHLVEESGIDIDFLGHRIRVKCGIARLAMAMRVPVLPMLAIPSPASPGEAHRLLAMPEMLPFEGADPGESSGDATRRIMQACYDALASAVAAAPQHWEFAFCLHRWLRKDAGGLPSPASALVALTGASQLLAIDPSMVISYPRQDGTYWLHVGRQKAYRLPDWSGELYDLLRRRPHAVHELVSHLRRRAAVVADAESLLGQLHAMELIQAAS